jgi:hypothetical protein
MFSRLPLIGEAGFVSRPVYEGFVIDNVVLGQGLLPVLVLPYQYHFSNAPYLFIN